MQSAVELHRRYLAGDFDMVDRIATCLERIEQRQSLNAFIQVYAESAREQAAALDKKRAAGNAPGPLAGTVIALKDNICMKGRRVTCASKILDNFVSPYNATVVEKIQAADGIIIGKTNLDEFAMGSSTENSAFGAARHPLDEKRVAGGSSGGSAIAVAAGMADLALGSDTGGSIRQPAAFCGVVGLKPTYGRVSRYGLVAFASSLDQIGTFGRSVADAEMLLAVVAGHDPLDGTSADNSVAAIGSGGETGGKGLRIGLPKEYFGEGLDPQIRKQVDAVCRRAEAAGATFEKIELPLTEYAIAVYYIIATAEASSNLARYDGVRYGYRGSNNSDLDSMYSSTRSEAFGPEVKRRIMLGTYVLSAGYYDAYYRKAQQVRTLLKNEYQDALKTVDVLLTPTTPAPAFNIGEKSQDPLQMYLSDIYTVTANLTGICGISIPAGKTDDGLPVGLQLLGNSFEEDKLLAAARFFEEI